jgi:hypothetical protein
MVFVISEKEGHPADDPLIDTAYSEKLEEEARR